MNSSVRRVRRPTMIRRQAIARHDPAVNRALGDQSMWLEDTRLGHRYELVAGSPTGGLLRLSGPGSKTPPMGKRLTLLGGRHAPVRFVVQVEDLLIHGGEPMLSVRWVVLSGPSVGEELQGILRTVLGVDAAIEGAGERPAVKGRQQRLVYQAERKTLRSMSTAAPVV